MSDGTRLILLTADECHLIRDAIERLHEIYLFSPAEEAAYESLMLRIPEPEDQR